MSNRLAVEQPTRGADRNRSLADQADPATDDMLLPSLKDGVTLLDVEGGRGVPILQSLVLDHLLLHAGPAFWVDANGHATTTTLSQIAPSRRLLDRIHVARGFTAYQHYGAVSDLPTAVNQSIQESTSDDSLRNRQPTENDDESPHTPRSSSRRPSTSSIGPTIPSGKHTRKRFRPERSPGWRPTPTGTTHPVLVTRTKRNDFTASGVTAADHHLERANPNGAAGRRRRLRDARLSRRRRCVLPDDVRVLAAAARSARHAGRRGTDDAGAVDDADSGRRRDGCHS